MSWETKQVNAQAPGKYPGVWLERFYTANCVDHTAHLSVEESLEKHECSAIKAATDQAHRLVNAMKDSSLMKEAFISTMREAGEEPLAIIQGTSNRYIISD